LLESESEVAAANVGGLTVGVHVGMKMGVVAAKELVEFGSAVVTQERLVLSVIVVMEHGVAAL
jgi:hypothetical protein